MGIQIHATENYRRVVELVQAGAIGPVREAHVWVSRAWGLQSEEAAKKQQGHRLPSPTGRRRRSRCPPDLDWDLWLGPAPQRPFNDVYVPGPKWYRWWDFGNGTMSDLGSHWNDLPFWALKLQAPLTIEASGPPPHPEIAPASMSATYEYGPRGDMPPVKLTWHQGENKPEIWTDRRHPAVGRRLPVHRRQGHAPGRLRQARAAAGEGFRRLQAARADAPARRPAITPSGSTPARPASRRSANFEYSGWLTEANHLGNVAYRVGKKLEWDADKMRATQRPGGGRSTSAASTARAGNCECRLESATRCERECVLVISLTLPSDGALNDRASSRRARERPKDRHEISPLTRRCAVRPGRRRAVLAAEEKKDDGFVPMFNGKDLTGWVNVNCAPEHLLREGRRGHHHRQADRLPAHRRSSTRTSSPTSSGCTSRPRPAPSATAASSSGPTRSPPSAPATRAASRCRCSSTSNTRTRRPARSRPPATATCSASGAPTCVPDRPHPLGWARCLPSENRAKGANEWNHYRVEANDGVIKLAVNGKVVSSVSKCSPRKGYLALESEGSECHFRNLKIKELPSTNPKPEEIADVAQGFKNLYTGLDLSGWKADDEAKKHWQPSDWMLRLRRQGQGSCGPRRSTATPSSSSISDSRRRRTTSRSRASSRSARAVPAWK